MDLDPAFISQTHQDSELVLTTKVMYEAPQMGNKKLPYSG
jgi:hypothetical protein